MFNLDNPKLVTLADLEGFNDVMDFLEATGLDSIVPAICTDPGCNATADLEPDQRAGYCEGCGQQTIQSAMVLAGMI